MRTRSRLDIKGGRTGKLISSWHNQRVGDAIQQQWLFQTETGYYLDYYESAYGGREWSHDVTDEQAQDIQNAHEDGHGWSDEAYQNGYRY